MYQAEALWIYFASEGQDGWPPYRFAVKVATGKMNAVSGEPWRDGVHRTPQDYLVAPEQPWIDGYCVRKGVIRQFVAMPLGEGYTAEEQLTGKAEHGGLQLQVFPMRREAYQRRFKRRRRDLEVPEVLCCASVASYAMGLAPGGEMAQEIYDDPYGLADWDLEHTSRCFVHIADALAWQAITGEAPPTQPPTAQQYAKAGLPWFDYYAADQTPLPGTAALGGLKGLGQLFGQQGKTLPDNAHVTPTPVIPLGPKQAHRPVREGVF
jgi:hypothetical protein